MPKRRDAILEGLEQQILFKLEAYLKHHKFKEPKGYCNGVIFNRVFRLHKLLSLKEKIDHAKTT